MKKLRSLLMLLGLSALPALAAPQTFDNVPVVDVYCSKKVAGNPDSHTRNCALKCEASGFGIFTSDQKFLKFDAAGNQKIEAALKASSKTDHLRVNVSGDVEAIPLRSPRSSCCKNLDATYLRRTPLGPELEPPSRIRPISATGKPRN